MPFRKVPLVNDHYYHILNRGVAKMPIFEGKRDFGRMVKLINYYQFRNTPLSFSRFIKLSVINRERLSNHLKEQTDFLVEVVCFCLMPNHFHFLLKQVKKEGIPIFLKNIQSAYAKYFNVKHKRLGPVFQNRFKAILVESNNQLLHLSRYIHLNPYSSLLVAKKRDLISYSWSSFGQYLGKEGGFCKIKVILDQFKNRREYQSFVFNQADYQRELDKIKHLLLE